MKKTNKILLGIGIVVVICIIIVLILLILSLNSQPDEQSATLKDNNAIITGETVNEINGISEYFNLKNCIQAYYTAVSNLRYSISEDEVGLGYAENRC